MTTTEAQTTVAGFSDDTLTAVRMTLASVRVLRDNEGNLRELTEDEVTFAAAVRREVKTRGMN